MRVCFNNIQPSFGTNMDTYTHNGREIRNNTCCARYDLHWKNFVQTLDSIFAIKNHVNIYSLACSDGSEPITAAIFIDTYSKNKDKYFPIFASDLNNDIIQKINANKKIRLYPEDFKRLGIDENDNKYFQRTGYYLLTPTSKHYDSTSEQFTHLLNEKLVFTSGDLIDKIREIKDESNSVVMCRNVLPYYYNEAKVKQFAKLCGQVLKENSLVILGAYDIENTKIKDYLLKNNFKEIEYNIFQKISRQENLRTFVYSLLCK